MQLQIGGHLDLAEALYREALRIEPQHGAANHCLGMLRFQRREPAESLPYLLVALEADPQVPDYWLGYLEALLAVGSFNDARVTLELARQHGLAGRAVEEFAMRLEAALSAPTRRVHPGAASEAAPAALVATSAIGTDASSSAAGPIAPLAVAASATQAVVNTSAAPASPAIPARAARRRDDALARRQERTLLNNVRLGQLADAHTLARALTERFPARGLGWKVLGAMLWANDRSEDAVAAMKIATRLLPADAEAHCNLGTTLLKLQRFAEAEAYMKTALRIDPGFTAAHVHLGDAYQLQGKYIEAEASIRAAIAARPANDDSDDRMIYSSLLFALCHNPTVGPESLFAEHRRIGELLEARQRGARQRHANRPHPDRRLKIGFVSGDFYDHSVAIFVEPILAQLSASTALELHAYYNHNVEDAVNRRLQSYFHAWNRVFGWSTDTLANKIGTDAIDILIDLSGHTACNRLYTFARKPAPLQVSWLGYPGTTGLSAMDYFFADRHFLPPGRFDPYFSEKLVYLPAAAIFQPSIKSPPINRLPALDSGHFTFGSFNRLGKINPATIELWAHLLTAVPNSRLLIGAMPADDRRDGVADAIAAHAIARDRLFIHTRSGMAEYLELHGRVDLCLDTVPYGGGTTTHHALWMGVPTLTIAGLTPSARQTAGILGVAELDAFVATDARDFVEKGLYWASHLEELSAVRQNLRGRLGASPNRRPDFVAAGFERALRYMWSRWCAGEQPTSFESTPSSTSVRSL